MKLKTSYWNGYDLKHQHMKTIPTDLEHAKKLVERILNNGFAEITSKIERYVPPSAINSVTIIK